MYFYFFVNLFYSISDTTDFLSLNVGIFLYATRIICTVLPWLNFFIAYSCLSVSTFKCLCNEFNHVRHRFFLGCFFPQFHHLSNHAFGPTNQCKVAPAYFLVRSDQSYHVPLLRLPNSVGSRNF
ncbi:unnamed protein product [Ixodes pacificus]